MENWWEVMSLMEHIYWIIALVASLLLVIVLIGTIIGGTEVDMEGVDADIDSDGGMGFQFLTVKNLIGFFTIFGWSGIACLNNGYSNTTTILISFICGLAMMLLMAWLFFFMAKQAESGTLNIRNAVGKIGEVYITIGKDRSSMGKIQIKVQGSLRELEAITDEEEDLTQGHVVKVLEVVSGELLLVEKLKK
ncbi:MAG: hypothetical protein WDZ35_15365 [Crocinitomicaceae bacterium]